MHRDDVQRWLDRYIEAWRANERGPIEALFTEDASYRYHPYDEEAVHGREAIATSWLDDVDDPDAWDAHYEPYAVDGDRAVATGWSRFVPTAEEPERTYHNVFLMRFGPDGRCSQFTELFMLEKGPE